MSFVEETLGVTLDALEEEDERMRDDRFPGRAALCQQRAAELLPLRPDALG
jgi:hypothetical protein